MAKYTLMQIAQKLMPKPVQSLGIKSVGNNNAGSNGTVDLPLSAQITLNGNAHYQLHIKVTASMDASYDVNKAFSMQAVLDGLKSNSISLNGFQNQKGFKSGTYEAIIDVPKGHSLSNINTITFNRAGYKWGMLYLTISGIELVNLDATSNVPHTVSGCLTVIADYVRSNFESGG